MDSSKGNGDNSLGGHSDRWKCISGRMPRSEIVFFTQVLLIFMVVIFCFVNLTICTDHEQLCIALLGSCLGYLLPNPQLKKNEF